MANQDSIVATPRIDLDYRLDHENLFASSFGLLPVDEWINLLVRSIDERVIDGVEFPAFPTPEFQSQIHGHFGAHSLLEAADFYRFIRDRRLTGPDAPWSTSGYLLDFGAGWGRITRPFLRDFPLRHITGYEPSNLICSAARSCNPFVSFVSGSYLPDGALPADRYDLVVGWSVFSHLSPKSAAAWLAEFQRVTRPGAAIVVTTWGRRFLERLQGDQAAMEAGEDIHWYSKECLIACGNLAERIAAYDRGEFVWFDTHNNELYGEAFIGPAPLKQILAQHAPKLSLAEFDCTSLPQDVLVIRHIG